MPQTSAAQAGGGAPYVWPKGVAKPAQRALAAAGLARLEQLQHTTEAELAALHGMGPKAIGALREALEANGLLWKAEGRD